MYQDGDCGFVGAIDGGMTRRSQKRKMRRSFIVEHGQIFSSKNAIKNSLPPGTMVPVIKLRRGKFMVHGVPTSDRTVLSRYRSGAKTLHPELMVLVFFSSASD